MLNTKENILKNVVWKIVWLPTFSKYLIFVTTKRQKCNFWVNYPFEVWSSRSASTLLFY